MNNKSSLQNIDANALEELYQNYLDNPDNLDNSWVNFFQGFELALKDFKGNKSMVNASDMDKEFKTLELIKGYRQRGHLFTRTNPVRSRRKYSPTLDLENFGLQKSDLQTTFSAGKEIGIGHAKLEDIINHLQDTYCDSVGVEYLYMRKPELVKWLQDKMESGRNRQSYSSEKRKHIYDHLKQAVGFEAFIHKKFVGQKRFSLEGTETLIPSLDAVIEKGAELGINEFVIGMAHRGRLNVLANIMQKPYQDIFREFIGKDYDDDIELGDVKYHLGYENNIVTDTGKKVALSLLPNPSHLEAVLPLVEGMSRSRIDSRYLGDSQKLAPIVIHGDAAVAGQGVVYETIQMSQLTGYQTGGTIHLVINNQVGFTTNYLEARSSTYCTDVAKVTRSPVFHVNGDDVESLIYTIQLAMEFRQKFKNDVFIDILSYRKYGHNEGDEPRFTQPLLYEAISKHKNPRDIYADKLNNLGVMSLKEAEAENEAFDNLLDGELLKSKEKTTLKINNFLIEEYKSFKRPKGSDLFNDVNTSVSKNQLKKLAAKLNEIPKDKKFFRKALKIIDDRKTMIESNRLDWSMCELLGYASLVNDGYPVRLSGQDSQRGTFAHRHAALVEEDTGKKYFPLNDMFDKQPLFHVFNSPLSEYSVMGFEYGYALAMPNVLTIWEAQFGDFSNVAQVIIDQYISSAAEKWGIQNGLVLLLPHGYEGQGPEHSSARIERFIAQATNNNMQLMNITSPANLFHALRRQMIWNYRLPLVIFTPKSLLRHPEVVSSLDDLSNGGFKEVIDDDEVVAENVQTLVLTSGKLFFHLRKTRNELKRKDVAIVRVEQLYPFPEAKIKALRKKYINHVRLIWAQDEPNNMGAWPYVYRHYSDWGIVGVTREESASPAGGLLAKHQIREQKITDKIFQI